MANPVGFEGATHVIRAPEGSTQDEYTDLPVAKDEIQTVSCWRLTPDELEEVKRTGVVWLSILSHIIYPQLVSGKALVYVDGKPSKAEPYIRPAPRTGI
jgi:hypothetical protein